MFIKPIKSGIRILFDPEKEWVFFVELIKILPAENISYPICVKSVGASPKQYKETNLPPPPPL